MTTIGYYKDRTSEFHKVRTSFQINSTSSIKMNVEENILSQTIDSLKNRLESIKIMITELNTLQQQYLSADMDDYTKLHDQIERKTSEIKVNIKSVQTEIIKFGRLKETENQQFVSNVQISLAEELSGLAEKFKKQNKSYLLKLKQRMMKFNDCFTTENEDGMYTIGFDDSQMNILTEAETNLKERMGEIKKITETVRELADMTTELNMIIYEQGSIIDRIDYNIDKTEVEVEFAVEEINKAEGYQKASQVKKIVLTLFMLILCALLVLFIKIII